MYKMFILFFILCRILSSCLNNNIRTEDTEYSVVKDSIKLSFDEDTKYDFFVFSEFQDSVYAITKLSKDSFIYIGHVDFDKLEINFEKFNVHDFHKLSKEYEIGNLNKCIMIDKNLLFFVQNEGSCGSEFSRLSIVDFNNGNTIYESFVDSKETFQNNKHLMHSNFKFINENKSVYYSTLNYDTSRMNSIVGRFDVEDCNSEIIDEIFFPEDYKEFDFKNEVTLYSNEVYFDNAPDSNIIISFPLSKYVGLFNYHTNTLEFFMIDNPNFRKPLSHVIDKNINYSKMLRQTELSYVNLNVFYDKFKNVYYRFFWQEMPEKNYDGKLTTMKLDKKMGVTVFTKEFEFVKDIVFDPIDGPSGLHNLFVFKDYFAILRMRNNKVEITRYSLSGL